MVLKDQYFLKEANGVHLSRLSSTQAGLDSLRVLKSPSLPGTHQLRELYHSEGKPGNVEKANEAGPASFNLT